MPSFTVKKDADGRPVWVDDKPVFVNQATNQDIEVDVSKLFGDNENLRHEAEQNRVKAEAAEQRLTPFAGLDAAQVTKDLAELANLRKQDGDKKVKPPSQEELDRLVEERFAARLSELGTELDGTKTKLTTAERERQEIKLSFQDLKLQTEYHGAAAKVGLRPDSIDDGYRYIRETFKVEDDGIPRKRDLMGKVVPGTDPSKPLSIEEELRTVTARDKRYWLPPAKGTDHVTIPGSSHGDQTGASSLELFNLGLSNSAAS